MILRWIKEQILVARITKFTLKRSDPISGIARDRSFESLAGEAVGDYVTEAFRLLPRRYKLILDQLHDENALSPEAHAAYQADADCVVIGSDGYYEHNPETKEHRHYTVQNRNFPWQDDPRLIERVSDRLRTKITDFVADHTQIKTDERGFYDTLKVAASSSIHDTNDESKDQ